MNHLYQVLAVETPRWREAGYPCEDYPGVGETLHWQTDPESGCWSHLRTPQSRALEVYWYLRSLKGTPHIFGLYRELCPKPVALLAVLGPNHDEMRDYVLNERLDALCQRPQSDDESVRTFRLEALRERLNLAHPRCIFALAMGAGKTVLISAIIGTGFAMALEHPDVDQHTHNVVFLASSKTVGEAARQNAEAPHGKELV